MRATIQLIGYLLIIAIATLGIAGGLLRYTAENARNLAALCHRELNVLQGHLIERHMIIMHLLDALPAQLGIKERGQRCGELLASAHRVVNSWSPPAIDGSLAREISVREKALWHEVEELVELLLYETQHDRDPCIAACLDGLKKAQHSVQASASAYNTASITYGDYLRARPGFVRMLLPRDVPPLIDLGTHRSHSC